MDKQSTKLKEELSKEELMVRELLSRVADKWTLLVIETLGTEGELRFTRLLEKIGGVSQKMLTQTLRQLERDGLVTRKVHAVVPPRVDYKLTPLGESLGEAVCSIWLWVESHLCEVESSRQRFDTRKEFDAPG
jgi:DNA-binding HxlR family transcriptional regulator